MTGPDRSARHPRVARATALALAVTVLVCALARPAAAQSPDEWIVTAQIRAQRELFLSGLGAFTRAIDGTYGDEGPAVLSSLDSMLQALRRWDTAIRAFETELRAAPPTADIHVALARVYVDRGRVDDALAELTAAGRLDPRRADIVVLQALLYGATSRTALSYQWFVKAAALAPSDPITFYGVAQQLTKLGERQEAVKALQAFLKMQQPRLIEASAAPGPFMPFARVDLLQDAPSPLPLFPPLLYAPGFALVKQGLHADAIARFREAAALDPMVAASAARPEQAVRASASLRRGDLASAVAEGEATVSRLPADAESHRLLGVAYWADEQYEKSVAACREAIRLNPRDERARLALAASLVAAGLAADAERALKDALDAVPLSGRAHYELGRFYQAHGRHADALQALERAIQLEPVVGVSALYQAIGAAHFMEGNLDKAIAAQSRRIELNPNDALAHRALGELYLQQERPDEALAELAASLLVDPGNSEAHALAAQVHQRTGRFADALEASQRALALNPDHAGARYTAATALMRLGRAPEAQVELEAFERLQTAALAREQRNSELNALNDEASVRLAQGDPEAAVRLLRSAIAIEPDQAVLHLQLGRALMAAGRHEEALQPLTQAAGLTGGDAHRYLADAYAALGRQQESEQERTAYQGVKQDRLRRLGERR